jgi:hypothetical protein
MTRTTSQMIMLSSRTKRQYLVLAFQVLQTQCCTPGRSVWIKVWLLSKSGHPGSMPWFIAFIIPACIVDGDTIIPSAKAMGSRVSKCLDQFHGSILTEQMSEVSIGSGIEYQCSATVSASKWIAQSRSMLELRPFHRHQKGNSRSSHFQLDQAR